MSRSNVAASVRQRLLNHAREEGEDFQRLLVRYALERLLHRMSLSDWHDQFVLKGAFTFLLWQGTLHRPTRDLDLMGYGSPEPRAVEDVFRAIAGMDEGPEDGAGKHRSRFAGCGSQGAGVSLARASGAS